MLIVAYNRYVRKSPVVNEIIYCYHEHYGLFYYFATYSYNSYLSFAKRWGEYEQTLTPNGLKILVFDAIIEECSCDKIKVIVSKDTTNGNVGVAVVDSKNFTGLGTFMMDSVERSIKKIKTNASSDYKL